MKFLDQILAAMATKDEAAVQAIVMKARDADEEEEKKKKESEDKARDEKEDEFKKEVRDSIKTLTDSVVKLTKDKAKDEEEEEERKKKEKAAEDKARDEAEKKEIEDEEPEASKAKDSAPLEPIFETVKMQAEIIAPGIKIPTFDKAAGPRATFKDCICGLRSTALVQGLSDQATAVLIEQVAGKTVDAAGLSKLSCGQTRALFNGVHALKKAANNAAVTRDGGSARTGRVADDAVMSPMERFKKASDARWNSAKK